MFLGQEKEVFFEFVTWRVPDDHVRQSQTRSFSPCIHGKLHGFGQKMKHSEIPELTKLGHAPDLLLF
jgi:hypothetical protein